MAEPQLLPQLSAALIVPFRMNNWDLFKAHVDSVAADARRSLEPLRRQGLVLSERVSYSDCRLVIDVDPLRVTEAQRAIEELGVFGEVLQVAEYQLNDEHAL